MKTSNIYVIDDLAEFLNADTTMLSNVTHLYLANSNAAAILYTPDIFSTFLDKLHLCHQMTNLNLENNNLAKLEIGLNVFDAVIKCLPQLQIINLRDNNIHLDDLLKIESTIHNIRPDIIVISAGCKSYPMDFVIPYEGWKLNKQLCELELIEMLDVAQYTFRKNPLSKKLFGYRYNNSNKKNISMNEEYLFTNMPYSALSIDGDVFLLPKFSGIPNNILEYNKSHYLRNIDPRGAVKHVSIIITRTSTNHELKFRLAKTQATKFNIGELIKEARAESTNLHKVSCVGLYQYRKYKNSHVNLRGKVYLISEYVKGEEGFDVMSRNIKKDKYAFISDTPVLLDHQTKSNNLILSIGYLLSLMKLHARGLIHTDIKPENSIVNPNRVELVDFGTSLPYGANTEIDHDKIFGTPSYVAPELAVESNKYYTYKNDYYSCGLIIRQLLYPVCCVITLGSKREFVFTSSQYNSVGSRLALHPEPFLAEHFATGIAANYTQEVSQDVLGLTVQNPHERSNITKAFFTFAELYPNYVQDVYELEVNITLDKIKCTLSRYTNALKNLNSVVCDAAEILARKYNLHNRNTHNTALNHLYRLLNLEYFLSVYELCNGEPPSSTSEIFSRSVRDIFNNQDIDLAKHEGIYYYNSEMEHRVDYHREFKLFMSEAFTRLAMTILDMQQTVVSLNIIEELKNMQVKAIELFRTGKSYTDILEYSQSSLNILLHKTYDNPELVSLLHTHFDATLNNAEIVMQQRSPKSLRLQLI